MGSDLSEVKSVIDTTFRRAMIWSIIFIVAATAILVSTAAQMIWSRMRLERTQHELLTREITQARRIQLAWLPKSESDLTHIDLSAVNMPASHISGDFYNWFTLPDGRVCVMIGDVTGHGMGAAFLMATTQLLVKIIMPRVPTPGRCLKEVNRQLCQQIFSGQFVTMQILALNPQTGRVEIATAGHPPPLIGAGNEFVPLKIESQFVLGVEASTDYPTESFELAKSSAIVLYTDGLTDAQAPTGDRFGLEGVRQSLTGQFPTSKAVAERIVSGVNQFRGQRELCDDLTLVTIQMQPPPSSGTTVGAA